jgi:hypothetical protein
MKIAAVADAHSADMVGTDAEAAHTRAPHVDAAATEATKPTTAKATSAEAAAVESATSAMESAAATKCRRSLRRHDGRRGRQQDCANRHTDFRHDYLPHYIEVILPGEPAPRVQLRPFQRAGRIDELQYRPWQEPIALMIVADLVQKMAGFPRESVINNNTGKMPAINRN